MKSKSWIRFCWGHKGFFRVKSCDLYDYYVNVYSSFHFETPTYDYTKHYKAVDCPYCGRRKRMFIMQKVQLTREERGK